MDRNPGTMRTAATAGALTPIIFATGVVVAATQFEGYSHMSQKISELGGAEATQPWIQNLNFATAGVLILLLVWALDRFLGAPRRGTALLGFFGLVVVAHSMIPCDAGCAGETAIGLTHNVSGLIGFVAAVASMFILGRRWHDQPAWRGHASFTRVVRWITISGLVWFVATQAADAQATSGLAQRIFAGSLLIWVGMTGLRLRQVLTDQDNHLAAPHSDRESLNA